MTTGISILMLFGASFVIFILILLSTRKSSAKQNKSLNGIQIDKNKFIKSPEKIKLIYKNLNSGEVNSVHDSSTNHHSRNHENFENNIKKF